MALVYSKLIHHSCYEIGHTWNPSCCTAAFEVFLSAFRYSCQMYGVVYTVMAVLQHKQLNKQGVLKLLQHYLRSVLFLTVNGFGYAGFFCLFQHILGHINYPTVSFLPGFLSALVAIQIERPSRRALLAIYLANVASECAFNACVGAGFVQPIPYGSVLLFIVAMAVLGGCYHSQRHQPPQMVAAVFRYFFGSAECGSESNCNQHSQLQLPPAYAGVFSQLVQLLRGSSSCCPHTGPCWRYAVKGAMHGAMKGGVLSVLFRAVTSLTSLLRRPSSLPSVLRLTPHLRAAACVWWCCFAYRLCCCAGRHARGASAAVDGVLAGAVAGAGMVLCPAPSLALYAFWKALESLCSVGVSCGALPAIPGATELLYSIMTGYLFHVSAVHQHYMKPSYWGMLMRLTDRRMAEFNRHLLHPYGQDSGRNFANFWPNYDRGELSPAFIERYSNGLTDLG